MNTSRLEKFVFDKIASSRIPGVSLAVVKGSKLVYARGFGVSDIAHNRPAEPETLYAAASITKSFAALAIMQLAQKRLLRLTDPVEKYVPCSLGIDPSKVRIEHLLTHTSGTCALGYIEGVLRHANGLGGTPLPIAGPRDVLTFMYGAEDWAFCPPGERWFYLNEGYVLLDRIVEKVSGETFDDYVRSHILQPLGMTRSYFREAEILADGKLATPYVVTPDSEVRQGVYLFNAFGGDAALVTSVLDLAKYMSMFINRGRGVMNEASYRAMTRPRVPISGDSSAAILGIKGASPKPIRYAYGLRVIDNFFGEPLVEHGGNLLVCTGYVGFMPKSGLGVAVLANGKGYSTATLGRAALAAMLGQPPEALTAVRMDMRMAAVTGTYETYHGTVKVRIVRDGDMLRMDSLTDSALKPLTFVPEQLEPPHVRFFTFTDGLRQTIEFNFSRGGVEMIYERYKFRRTGPL